ncbi:MAG: hypothetical protein ABIP51_05395 [Bacteroidia bacterium]
MTTKTGTKKILKMEKGILQKEISSLKGTITDYKAERKANWKSFKKKTNNEIDTIKKSIGKLSVSKKK